MTSEEASPSDFHRMMAADREPPCSCGEAYAYRPCELDCNLATYRRWHRCKACGGNFPETCPMCRRAGRT